MIQVSIIGSGNVAQHLISAFVKTEAVALVQVLARHPESIGNFPSVEIITDFQQLREVDLYIIAVTDQAIAEVSKKIPFANKLVAHTSGSVPMSALADNNRKAVLYPVQTFSKNKAVDFSSIPIGLESENEDDFKILSSVAKSISNHVFVMDSVQRKALHVAAVFVSNFTNHLYQIGADLCNEHQLSFDILKPLIEETAAKILVLSPAEAQTGPAKRKDQQTIDSHLALLNDENQKAIYTLLTQSIQQHE
ncbi:Rossmann-like and DUF2520 domain-containing protein [Flavobacterium sp.]|uniref:Rossmann-like and DUF2520 domain-containing protein n=1 Tax=Flavobacterium sp. TaxID=239 RepID=UPI0026248A19|nr:Rossmann-like and DUF2520 domain-containing protein [Flavobacterium sp.]